MWLTEVRENALKRKDMQHTTTRSLPWSQPHYPREITPEPTEKEGGWTPQPVWMTSKRQKSLTPARIRTPNRQTCSQVRSLYRSLRTRRCCFRHVAGNPLKTDEIVPTVGYTTHTNMGSADEYNVKIKYNPHSLYSTRNRSKGIAQPVEYL